MTISLRRRLRLSRTLDDRRVASILKGRLRAGLIAAIIAGVVVSAPTRSEQQVNPTDCKPANCPPPTPKVDLAFILDRSGSLDARLLGQTYNVQIEGVLRALRDPSVIPRDGSAAVSVWTFAGDPSMVSPLKEIGSAADAEAIATIVEGLKCATTTCNPTGLCPVFGSNPASNYAPAILFSYFHLNQNHRSGARQALLLSSDGKPTDLPEALIEAAKVRDAALISGVELELDLILISPDSDGKKNADQIVFPKPADDLPGKTLAIETGKSNSPCASLSEGAVQMDFDRQVLDFATHTRNVFRRSVAKIPPLIVNTEADPLPNIPATGGILSLRQAIELANCTGGGVTITFASNVNTISPLAPLPALTAPEIKIDGLDGCEVDCRPLVIIDGSKTGTTNCEQGDGILIRSNRNVVRGLRIINFKRAGVGVEPVRLLDNVGFNRIELNKFENNKKAGVCVIDPPQGQPTAVFHNVGNTISMNNISGSETPIDLALDGPTPNDPGDLDEGPNTLLNFPDKLSVADTLDVTVAASGVSLSGQVTGPTAAGATVEIFAIRSFRPVPGGRVIDRVTFLKQATTNADGSFTVTGLPDSPTCGYTATVTDLAGNTSELMFPCAGFAVAKATDLDFGDAAVPNQRPQSGAFSIENTGCSPLVVSFASLIRNGFSNKLGDDLAHFDIGLMFVGPNGPAIAIQPGQIQTFTATFDPAIPMVVTGDNKLRAAQVLAATTISTLKLEHNGCAKSDKEVILTARVDGAVKLIDPKSPRNSPLVTLTRSGDDLFVSFSVFDSDLNVNKVNYEFFKIRDNQCTDESVPAEIDQDLAKAISGRIPKLVTGQSFTVIQRFTGAKKNPEAGCVRVTVSDGTTSASATSSPGGGSVASASLASNEFRRQRGATIVGPPLKLPSKPKESRATGTPRAGEEKEKRQ